MARVGLSTPIKILSLAFSRSICSTNLLSRRAAKMAASLIKLANSAPENPGVPRPILRKSQLFDSGTFLL